MTGLERARPRTRWRAAALSAAAPTATAVSADLIAAAKAEGTVVFHTSIDLKEKEPETIKRKCAEYFGI